ncbi:hypothetical protein GCM10008012_56490 [Rhizobium anhuiense]|nr:hypothetical protein GCM10008012_56490 [Rhizobium anhuiense]
MESNLSDPWYNLRQIGTSDVSQCAVPIRYEKMGSRDAGAACMQVALFPDNKVDVLFDDI